VTEILGSEAGQLLIDRARIATGRDVIGATDPAAAARLVTLLGGNPLSITLAAGWLRSLTVEQYIQRLVADPLRVLTEAGARAHRHASQEAVLRSTYEGCSPAEQECWQTASVFAEWFDLDAATAVYRPEADEQTVLELITSLTDRAVLDVTRSGGRARYRTQPGVVRDFGRAELDLSARAGQVRRTHREHVAALVARAAHSWLGPREIEVMAEVHDAAPDIFAALESMAAVGDGRAARRLCRDWIATRSPYFHGYPDWTRRALDRVLPPETALATGVQAEEAAELVTVYAAAAWMALNQGRCDAADLHLQSCQTMVVRAEDWLAEADPAGAAAVRGAAMFASGNHLLLVSGDPDAIDVLAQARALLRQAGEEHAGAAHMATLLGAMSAALVGTDPEAAYQAAQVCVREARAADAPWATAWAQWPLALAELRRGRLAAARQEIVTGLRLQRDLRDSWGRTWSLELCGWILAASLETSRDRVREGDAAAWLLGASARVQRRVGVDLRGLRPFARRHDRAMQQVTAALGAPWAQKAFAAGAESDVDAAMRCALGEERPPLSVTIADNEAIRKLTPKENEVVRRLILGETDAEIAEVMILSVRTVETHVTHILQKLGAKNRAAAAALLTQ
jgi:DNA-binding CsgD family transcriptional regulator